MGQHQKEQEQEQVAPSFDFIDWAADAVFSGLIDETPEIAPTKTREPTFCEWSAVAVFSGLPAGRRETRGEETNDVVSPACGNKGMVYNRVQCSGNDGSVGDQKVANSKDNNTLKLQNVVAVAVSGVDSDGNNDALTERNVSKNIDTVVGGKKDETICIEKLNLCKKKLLQAAAAQAQAQETAPTPTAIISCTDENDKQGAPLNVETTSRQLDLVVSSCKQETCQSKVAAASDEINVDSQPTIYECQTPSFHDWASSIVFSGLQQTVWCVSNDGESTCKKSDILHEDNSDETAGAPTRKGGINDQSEGMKKLSIVAAAPALEKAPPTAKILFADENDVQLPIDTGESTKKVSIRKTKLLHVTEAQSRVTTSTTVASDENNDEKVPIDACESKENTIAVFKRKMLQAAATQAQVTTPPNTAPDRNDEKQVPMEARTKLGGQKKTAVSDEVKVDPQPQPFHDWATSAVFSGLLAEKPEPPQQTIPSFNDWARGAVFRCLPNSSTIKADARSKPKVSTPLPEMVEVDRDDIINRITSEVAQNSKIKLDDTKTFPPVKPQEHHQTEPLTDSSKDIAKAEGKPKVSQDTKTSPPVKPQEHYQTEPLAELSKDVSKAEVEPKVSRKSKLAALHIDSLCLENYQTEPLAELSKDIAKAEGKKTVLQDTKTSPPVKPQEYYQTEPLSELSKDVSKAEVKSKVSRKLAALHIVSLCLENENKQKCSTISTLSGADGKEGMPCNPRQNGESSFNEWALHAVFSGLIPKPEGNFQIMSSFRDWERCVAFGRMDDKMETSDSDRNAGSGRLDASGHGSDRLEASERSEKSVDFSQIICPTRRDRVTFRDRDSYIFNASITRSGTSIDVNEASMDLGTLLEDGKDSATPNLSDMANFTMEKSVGDLDFSYESNSSILPQSHVISDSMQPQDTTRRSSMNLDTLLQDENGDGLPDLSEMTNFDMMDMAGMGKSVGELCFNYDENHSSVPPHCSAISDYMQPQDSDSARLELPRHPTCDIERSTPAAEDHIEEKKDTSLDLGAISDKQSLRQQSEMMKNMIRSGNSGNQSNEFAGAKSVTPNDHEKMASNIPSREVSNPSEDTTATKKDFFARNATLQYAIPTIIEASVMKERAEERVGLVFTEKRHKILLAKMMPDSPFRHTHLGTNDELLLINGHRIKNAKKAAEFTKASDGNLTITAFKGKRPRESGLEMMRLSLSDCNDIHCFTNNGMVHIISCSGRFSRSGKIKPGDIILSINGIAVETAERAAHLLRKCSQEDDQRPLAVESEYDIEPNAPQLVPGGLVIILIFSLSKLRCRLAKKLSNGILTWNRVFSECAIKDPSGRIRRVLHIHNDGNCEDIRATTLQEEIDPRILEYIETFASNFYSQFQDAMIELRQAMQCAKNVQSSRDNVTALE